MVSGELRDQPDAALHLFRDNAEMPSSLFAFRRDSLLQDREDLAVERCQIRHRCDAIRFVRHDDAIVASSVQV